MIRRDTRSELLAILAGEPDVTGAELSRRLCISRQRVHQILKGLGKTSPRGPAIAVGHREEYKCWNNMIARCIDRDHDHFRHYGGRGITVCARWLHSFPAFLLDMGARPSPKHSIDRINNYGNYEPGNCRWATWTEQANNKRNNRRDKPAPGDKKGQKPKVHAGNHREIEEAIHRGERIEDIAKRHGMSQGCLRMWYPADALTRIRAHGPRQQPPKQKRKA